MSDIKKVHSVAELKALISDRKGEAEDHVVLTVSAGTCGQARGSLKVIEALEEAIQKENLSSKVKVKVSGCHGFCE